GRDTYEKPSFQEPGQVARELNRLDIKNRVPMSAPMEESILRALEKIWSAVDALIVLDQVSEPNCGVVTDRVRERLADLGAADPKKFVLADSRERIGLFRSVSSKPNQAECLRAVGPGCLRIEDAAARLASQTGRTVFCTCGAAGILMADATSGNVTKIPAYPVEGAIDIVGAGDSTSAAIACAVASGMTAVEAAALGCLVASITVQQIG